MDWKLFLLGLKWIEILSNLWFKIEDCKSEHFFCKKKNNYILKVITYVSETNY